MKLYKDAGADVLYLEEGDEVRLITPASFFLGRLILSCVYVSVNKDSKLEIVGGSDIIGLIAGEGMKEKLAP